MSEKKSIESKVHYDQTSTYGETNFGQCVQLQDQQPNS